MAASLGKVLREQCEVHVANSFAAGAALVQSMAVIDLLVTDLDLRDHDRRDGVHLAELLRSRFPAAPVLLVSGTPSMDRINRVLALSGTSFIEKPFEPARFRAEVTALTKRSFGNRD